jgi:hypothetical protein
MFKELQAVLTSLLADRARDNIINHWNSNHYLTAVTLGVFDKGFPDHKFETVTALFLGFSLNLY